MAANDIHHFVPAFLLRAWRSPDDGLLTTFKRVRDGKVVSERYSPKGVAREKGLYAINGLADKNTLETRFFTKELDEPSSSVYHALCKRPTEELSEEQTLVWSQFLVALGIRGPDTVASARNDGESVVTQLTETDKERALASGSRQISLEEFKSLHPHALRDMGPWAVAKAATSPRLNGPVFEAN